MAGPLVASLNSLFEKFSQFDSLKGFVRADLGLDELGQLKTRAGQLDSDIKRSTDTVERLAEALSRDPGNELLGGRLEKARTRLDGLRREASQTSEQLKVLANRMAPPDPFEVNFPGPDKPRLGPPPDKPGKAKKDKPEFVGPEVPQSLKDALERLERTDVTKVARLRDELERLLSIRSAGGATPEVAEAIESVEAELLKLDPATKAASDRLERLNQLLGATPSAQLEATRQEMLLLAEALARNEISAEQFTEAAATRLELLPEQLRTTKSLTEELGLTFSSAFEDAIVNGGELRDVLKGLAQDIARIATRKLISEPLGNAFTSFLGGLFGGTARTGMAFDEGGVRRFRLGGVTNRPTYFRNGGRVGLMSEEGQAEAVMPLVRGKGGKLGVQASGQGGGTVVYQTNHYSGGVSRAELAAFTAANNRRLIEGLQQSRNRDGDFA